MLQILNVFLKHFFKKMRVYRLVLFMNIYWNILSLWKSIFILFNVKTTPPTNLGTQVWNFRVCICRQFLLQQWLGLVYSIFNKSVCYWYSPNWHVSSIFGLHIFQFIMLNKVMYWKFETECQGLCVNIPI